MERLRFLLPLIVLTLAVAGVSYGVRSYNKQPLNIITMSESSDSSQEGTQESREVVVNSNNPSETLSPTTAPGFFARLFGRGGSSSNSVQTTTAVSPTPKPVEASFNQSSVEVPINQERTVSVTMETGVEKPNAYTFNMRFDPKSVVIVKVDPGDIWERSNVLENKFDNNSGSLTFSAGQAFGTQKTNGSNLIKITLMTKSTAASGSELVIEDTSKFAYVGLDYAVPVKSKSIQIQVKK